MDYTTTHREESQVNLFPFKIVVRGGLWIRGFVVLGLCMLAPLLLACELLGSGDMTGGERAPDFTLPTNEGTFTLSEQRGNVVFLFYSSPQ